MASAVLEGIMVDSILKKIPCKSVKDSLTIMKYNKTDLISPLVTGGVRLFPDIELIQR